MSIRFLLGMALAFMVVFVVGVAAVISITSMTDRPSVSDLTPSSHVPVPLVVQAATSPAHATIGTVMPDVVLVSDIDSLAAAVKLTNLASGVSKDVWAREVPIAQKLLTGMCDCDQRNWLKHFVQTGQQAVAGSSEYAQSVRHLAALRRCNADLISSQGAH